MRVVPEHEEPAIHAFLAAGPEEQVAALRREGLPEAVALILVNACANRCFFCCDPIPEGEASVEHLIASSNGGAKEDENCVVCCKAVNAAFGNLPIKAKLRRNIAGVLSQ